MSQLKRSLLSVVVAAVTCGLLLACRTSAPLVMGGATVRAARASAPLFGRVDFSSIRQTQATLTNVINYATVSLIDPSTGETITSGVTDASGNFSLNMPGFTPTLNGTYVVEAIKGLNAQLPGYTAPRFRTILEYTNSGWLSLSASVPGSTIVIDQYTTAIALVSALDPLGLPAASAMGKVKSPAQSGLNASPTWGSHPDSQLSNLAGDIVNTLGQNLDPVTTTNAILPTINTVQPNQGAVNQPVTISGAGFVPGATTVTISGVTMPILMLSKSQIICTVPVGAPTGNVVVTTTRGGASNGVPFSIPNSSAVSVTAISPNPVRPLASVTVSGNGFDPSALANNVVTISGTPVTPSIVNNTSLIFQVPAAAQSGFVNVKVNGQTSNNYFLTVDSVTTPQITSTFPSLAPCKGVVTIYGQNFGPTGSVVFGNYTGNVISWSPGVIRAQIPWWVTPGNLTVSVFAPLGIATTSFNILDGAVTSWANVPSIPANIGGPGVHAYVGANKLWVWGGNGLANVAYMPLNPDGSFAAGSWTASAFVLPEGTTQDDNPNSRTVVKNRLYYTASNANNHVDFAALDPLTGDITSFGRDPVNDLPPTWLGKDLGLIAGDKYVYILGSGASCQGGNPAACNGNAVGTMQAPILDSGGIGQWTKGPDNISFGEDGLPFIVGDSIFMVGGTIASPNSQQSVINVDGTMAKWATMSVPLLPQGSELSTMPMRIGRHYFFYEMWSDRNSWVGEIQNDLVPQQMTKIVSGSTLEDGNILTTPSGAAISCGIAHVDVQIGKYLYLISTNQGGATGFYQSVAAGTLK